MYRNQLSDLDHTMMASQYIGWFESTMRQIFPNISNAHNQALAWGGLGETAGWAAKSTIEKNAIVAINADYRSGSIGTPCP